MRTMLLIAAAGLTGLVATPTQARAQYYGWGYYRPYYPVPYAYYPAPYHGPPPYEAPPPRIYRQHYVRRIQHHILPARRGAVHRSLINPLLGPLPGIAATRRN